MTGDAGIQEKESLQGLWHSHIANYTAVSIYIYIYAREDCHAHYALYYVRVPRGVSILCSEGA